MMRLKRVIARHDDARLSAMTVTEVPGAVTIPLSGRLRRSWSTYLTRTSRLDVETKVDNEVRNADGEEHKRVFTPLRVSTMRHG